MEENTEATDDQGNQSSQDYEDVEERQNNDELKQLLDDDVSDSDSSSDCTYD